VTTTSTTGRQRDELELRPRRVTPTAGRAWAFAGAAAGLACCRRCSTSSASPPR
jgi:hypothetical protein